MTSRLRTRRATASWSVSPTKLLDPPVRCRAGPSPSAAHPQAAWPGHDQMCHPGLQGGDPVRLYQFLLAQRQRLYPSGRSAVHLGLQFWSGQQMLDWQLEPEKPRSALSSVRRPGRIAAPYVPHLLTGSQQLFERPHRFHSALLQQYDAVCSLQRRAPVRHHQAGLVRRLGESLPQRPLRLHVEC